MNLTPIELSYLAAFARLDALGGPPSLNELGAAIGRHKVAVRERVLALVAKGALIENKPKGYARRYALTDAGAAVALAELARRGPAVVVPPVRIPIVRLSNLVAVHARECERVGAA